MIDDLPVIGRPNELSEVAMLTGASRVIVSPGDVDEHELEELLHRCRTLSLKVSVLPQLSDVLGPAVEIDDVEGVMVLGVNPPWLPRSSRALKRGLDLLLAGSLLILFSPVMFLIAVAIKLGSRGPVFFRQQRVGKGDERPRRPASARLLAQCPQRGHGRHDGDGLPRCISPASGIADRCYRRTAEVSRCGGHGNRCRSRRQRTSCFA